MIDLSKLIAIKFHNHKGDEICYNLFERRSNKGEALKTNISIVYGCNGSGKSTLARNLSNISIDSGLVKFLDEGNNELPIDRNASCGIFVFNERYVADNIQIKEDENLKNIVLFGDDIELDAKLQKLREKNKRDRDKLQRLKNKLRHCRSRTNEIINSIQKIILSPYGWAGRESTIKRHKNNISHLEDGFIEKFSKMENISWTPLDYKKELENFNNKVERYKKFPDYHNDPGPVSLVDPYPINEVVEMLSSAGNDRGIINRVRYVSLPDVKLYEAALPERYFKTLESLFEQIRKVNNQINDLIIRKANNPFEQIHYDQTEWKDLISGNHFIYKINERLNDYWSDNLDEIKKFEEELIDSNLRLALYEAGDQLADYRRNIYRINMIENNIKDIKNDIGKDDQSLKDLETQHFDVVKATNEINRYLDLIFGERRLSIEVKDEDYVIYNGTDPVHPGHLSTGERNILALCYFFISIANNQKYEDAFSSPKLIVLDDPISSFDFDNKYGILLAISCFLDRVLESSGRRTKILILTHDLTSAYELDKLANGIVKSGEKVCYKISKRGNGLASIDFKDFDIYQIYLDRFYRFACGDKLEDGEISHNSLRRLFEAYSTFELNLSVGDVLTSKVVEAAFEARGLDVSYYGYFSKIPLRAFIHQDSHAETQIHHGDFVICPSLSEENFRKFSRDILCLMYIISPYHIMARLGLKAGGSGPSVEKFDEWIADIIERR